METGTGKTYVYLRTIYELHKHYGFSKFIIVSVTGDKATLQIEQTDTDQEVNPTLFQHPSTLEVRVNYDLYRHYPALRGMKVLQIFDQGENSKVKFSDKAETEITKYKPFIFSTEKGQCHSDRTVQLIEDTYPVYELPHRIGGWGFLCPIRLTAGF